MNSAPLIAGYTVQSRLGGGGFADVYLCQDQRLTRLVAIKVLRSSNLSSAERKAFEVEANAMAQLSHPNIAVIHGATVTDDGRPALIMAYFPGRDLGKRYVSEQIPIDEVLRVGIQIADAVETAHRAQILHRDIKPANILMTESGKPFLSDFGIASLGGRVPALSALSLPWAPAEVIRGAPNDERSDIYSLAASLYAMLARRSPFESPRGPNDEASLIERICHCEVTPTGRPGTPPELEAILARSLSRNPDDRAQTALEFARELQSVQRMLRLVVTEVENGGLDSADGRRPASTGLPMAPTQTARRWQGIPGPANDWLLAATGLRADPAPAAPRAIPLGNSNDNADTSAGGGVTDSRSSTGSSTAGSSTAGADRPAGQNALLWIGACCLAVATAIGAWLFWPAGAAGPAPSDSPSGGGSVVDPNDFILDPPMDLTLEREDDRGTVVARWSQPTDWQPGDWYVWRMTRSGVSSASQRVAQPIARIPGVGESDALCVLVSHRRDGAASPFLQKCMS